MNDDKVEKIKPKYYPPIPKFPIYGLIVCGVILILMGIYLQVNSIEILGKGGEDSFGVNGPTTLFFGIVLLIFPIYTLVQQNKERKQYDKKVS